MERLNLPRHPRKAPAAAEPVVKPARKKRAIGGAMVDRLRSDWVTAPLSADANLRWSLPALRARSRDLVLNNEYASRFVHLASENVIGQHGIEAQPANVLNGKLNTELNRRLKAAWQDWGDPETCTADGRHSWVGLQQLILRTWPADGEVFVRIIPGFRNRFGVALQLIDPDLCDDTFERERGPSQNAVRMGVEIDDWDRPVGYWFWTSHPRDYRQDMRRERIRIPASEIVHLFIQYRPGQTRGYPFFTPVLLKSKMLDGYAEAELVAARMGAAAMGFLETSPEADLDDAENEHPQVPILQAEPGTFPRLPPGVKVTEWAPDHPSTAYGDFTIQVLSGFAAGLNVSYSSFTGDLSRANYGSQRGGLLQERDGWQLIQQHCSTHLHRRVYRAWLNWSLLSGAVEAGTRNAAEVWRCWWQPRGWPWIDPESDLNAAEREIQLGLKSRTTICMERGYDLEEEMRQIAEEQKLAAQLGISITPEARAPTDAAVTEKDIQKELAKEARNGTDDTSRLRLARG